MMFGTHELFDYIECSKCGCLQIAEIPKDMAKYYPPEYFSIKPSHTGLKAKEFLRLGILKLNRLLPKDIIPRYMRLALEPPFVLNLIRDFHISKDSKILEVGCGEGGLLKTLFNLGFENVSGLEPYAECKIRNNISIFKIEIEDLNPEAEFDVVIFNHSLEHISNQLSTLEKISTIISRVGICQIRIPLKTDYVWQHFGTNWVQLDAPRHFYLHTVESLTTLARTAGLTVRSAIFDSTEFQFWGSEQYKQNIPLKTKNSYWTNPERSIFRKDQIKVYSRMARKLNRIHQGDQATFYLTKTYFD